MRCIKKVFILLLLVLMFIFLLAGCADGSVGESGDDTNTDTALPFEKTEYTEMTDTSASAESDTTDEPMDEMVYNVEKWGKVYCSASASDDFADNEILLIVYPPYNDKKYVPDDFAEIDCTDVTELCPASEANSPGRILKLTIDGHSKENVIAAIKKLEGRADIYCADPNSTATGLPDDDD